MDSFRYPLDDIRARCDVVEIISPYVALRRSGKNLKGLCPFHSEKTPSFIVNPDTQRWMCFGCSANGDVFTFLMRIEGLTFPEAVEQLAGKAGIDISRTPKDVRSAGERDLVLRVNNLATAYFRKCLERSSGAREYLSRRGITSEAVEKFKLGCAEDGWRGLADYLRSQGIKPEDAVKAGLVIAQEKGPGFYDRFRNRLMFPIQDVQDRVIGFGGRTLGDDVKYLNTPETRLFVKNRTLYALNFARKAISAQGCVILVEGYMDALTAHSAGFENVVATMGTALTAEHVNVLSRYTKTAVLAFDADSAGMSAAIRSGPMFEAAEFDVRVAVMPAGEDPDSLIRRGDRAVFAELVAEAAPIPDYRLRNIAAKYDLNTRDGQLAALKESVPIIAEVSRQVDRERLIAVVAPYHPNYQSGTTPAEVHIRQEVEGRRARMETKKGPAKTPRTPAQKVDLLSEEGKAVRRAERELLGMITCHGARAGEVFSRLSVDEFVSEDAKIIAAAVQEELQNGGTLNIDALAMRLAGTPGEMFLNELLVNHEDYDTPVDDLIGTILIYRKREQEKRFRALAEKIQKREIDRTDPEYAEFCKLMQELHNHSPGFPSGKG